MSCGFGGMNGLSIASMWHGIQTGATAVFKYTVRVRRDVVRLVASLLRFFGSICALTDAHTLVDE